MKCQGCQQEASQLTKPVGGRNFLCKTCLDEFEPETE